MFKNKKLLWILGAAVAVLLIVLVIVKKGKSTEIQVSTENTKLRDIVEVVSASGKISPEFEVKLSPDISGEITEVFVKEGDQVKKGQIVAKINPEYYTASNDKSIAALNNSQANLSTSKARLAQVKAQFKNAEATYQRNKTLHEQKAISDAEYGNALAQYESAKAEVESAEQGVVAANYIVKSSQSDVRQAQQSLSKTSVYAPVSGTISKLNIEKGERVAGASQFGAGTEIMRIANLQSMEVKVTVNENDIVRVKMNDTALIEVDAFQNKQFKGIVTKIGTSANSSGAVPTADQITNFEVKIRILPESYADLIAKDKPNASPFRPGMSATVDIQTNHQAKTLTVPIQAVTTRADSTLNKKKTENEEEVTTVKTIKTTQEYVFKYDKGIAKMVKVKTGIQNNKYIQILEGLKENEEVISAPYRAISKTLKDGDKVKKVDVKKLYNTK